MRCSFVIHRFDPKTHRCVGCQRFAPGFAPKKAHVKPRDECQVCEGKWALDDAGKLGHHGYTRPGHGWIEGDCFGVNHKPFPATDALEAWRDSVQAKLDGRREALAKLPKKTEIKETFNEYNPETRRNDKLVVKVAKKPKGKVRSHEEVMYLGGPWDEWWRAYKRVERELTQTIEAMERELKRVLARIEKADKARAGK